MDEFWNLLKNLAENYKTLRTQEFGKNPIHQVLREASDSLQSNLEDVFKVDASVGKGRWTDIPWAAVFHRHETETAQSGLYPVYLIDYRSERVILSMNQGVTELKDKFGVKEARDQLVQRAGIALSRVGELPTQFNQDPISFRELKHLYTSGHAFGATYSLADLIDYHRLENELALMLELYKKILNQGGYISVSESQETGATVKEAKKWVIHNKYEGRANTERVKKLRGTYICDACMFDFSKIYGKLGEKYIEAHHLKPFSELDIDHVRELSIKDDFALLCSNCHRMIHRMEDPSDIEGLKSIIKANLEN